MFEALKKSIFAGIGLANMTKEKLEELSREIADQASLSEEQASEFSKELAHRAASARKDLADQIDKRMDHWMIQAGILKAGVSHSTDQAKLDFDTWLDTKIDASLSRLQIARSDEIQALEQRIMRLEEKA